MDTRWLSHNSFLFTMQRIMLLQMNVCRGYECVSVHYGYGFWVNRWLKQRYVMWACVRLHMARNAEEKLDNGFQKRSTLLQRRSERAELCNYNNAMLFAADGHKNIYSFHVLRNWTRRQPNTPHSKSQVKCFPYKMFTDNFRDRETRWRPEA